MCELNVFLMGQPQLVVKNLDIRDKDRQNSEADEAIKAALEEDARRLEVLDAEAKKDTEVKAAAAAAKANQEDEAARKLKEVEAEAVRKLREAEAAKAAKAAKQKKDEEARLREVEAARVAKQKKDEEARLLRKSAHKFSEESTVGLEATSADFDDNPPAIPFSEVSNDKIPENFRAFR